MCDSGYLKSRIMILFQKKGESSWYHLLASAYVHICLPGSTSPFFEGEGHRIFHLVNPHVDSYKTPPPLGGWVYPYHEGSKGCLDLNKYIYYNNINNNHIFWYFIHLKPVKTLEKKQPPALSGRTPLVKSANPGFPTKVVFSSKVLELGIAHASEWEVPWKIHIDVAW